MEFEDKYKYSNFKVWSSKNVICSKISYMSLCQCLEKNKSNLFGVYISELNSNRNWDADFFLRYETEI